VLAHLLRIIRRICVTIFSGIYWVDEKVSEYEVRENRRERHDNSDYHHHDVDPDGPADLSNVEVALQQVYFGQIVVECPQCSYETEEVGMGITTIEHVYEDDDDDKDSGLPNMVQMGIIVYPCGHLVHSPHLTDKVIGILNARDLGHLKPEMIKDLSEIQGE
jgi:hypothetical protein